MTIDNKRWRKVNMLYSIKEKPEKFKKWLADKRSYKLNSKNYISEKNVGNY